MKGPLGSHHPTQQALWLPKSQCPKLSPGWVLAWPLALGDPALRVQAPLTLHPTQLHFPRGIPVPSCHGQEPFLCPAGADTSCLSGLHGRVTTCAPRDPLSCPSLPCERQEGQTWVRSLAGRNLQGWTEVETGTVGRQTGSDLGTRTNHQNKSRASGRAGTGQGWSGVPPRSLLPPPPSPPPVLGAGGRATQRQPPHVRLSASGMDRRPAGPT